MSKGKGGIQRAILDALAAEDWADSVTIACMVFGRNPCTESQAASVRRALRRLVEAGEITDLGREWRDGRRLYAIGANRSAPPLPEMRSDRHVARVLGMAPNTVKAIRARHG